MNDTSIRRTNVKTVNCRISGRSLYKRDRERKDENSGGKVEKKQTVRAREAEGTGGNVLKADRKKSLKVTEEKLGDLGNV